MMNITQTKEPLTKLGLSQRQADIYLVLLKKGILTPLEISKYTEINRTTVYRIIEKLKSKGLVEEIVDERGKKFKAADPEKLNYIIAQKQAELGKIKSLLPDLINNLNAVEKDIHSKARFVYFKGQDGLKQLLWNTLKAAGKTKVLGYGYMDWNQAVGKKFAEELREEYVNRKIKTWEILNKKPCRDFTDNQEYLDKWYQNRLIPKSTLEINHDTYIYNDVFAFAHFYQEEFFGVEIHSREIAKTQKQIFNILWNTAEA